MKIYTISYSNALRLSIMFCIMLFAGFVVFTNPAALEVYSMNTQLEPIYSVDVDEKIIAFTFDVSWDDDYTKDIVKVLNDAGVKSTFFFVGQWSTLTPDKTLAVSESGHEIGSMSDSYIHLTQIDINAIADDLHNSKINLGRYIQGSPTLLKVPYGEYSQDLALACESEGLTPIYFNLDSKDLKAGSAKRIISRVVMRARAGDIIAFNTISEYTLEALPLIIEKLHAKGYSIVTVSELIYLSGENS